jgi:hypothetical protein
LETREERENDDSKLMSPKDYYGTERCKKERAKKYFDEKRTLFNDKEDKGEVITALLLGCSYTACIHLCWYFCTLLNLMQTVS